MEIDSIIERCFENGVSNTEVRIMIEAYAIKETERYIQKEIKRWDYSNEFNVMGIPDEWETIINYLKAKLSDLEIKQQP